MLELFGCVAAVLAGAAPVARNLGEIAQGGLRVLNFAGGILRHFRKQVPKDKQQAVIRQALTQAAAMPQAEFDKKAEEIVEKVLQGKPEEDRKAATEYLKLIPARIRATFSRQEDRTGTTVPANWAASRPEDIAAFLPTRLPMFKEGDTPPEAPRWVLVERLAIGGFGEVWKARSKTMQNSFSAFKFCLDPASQKSIFANELENVELVKNELIDHPHIVKLLDAHLEGETPWLQYEYIPGGDLGQLVTTWADDVSVRSAMAVEKIGILADTLDHCHNRIVVDSKPRTVIHRDMKPANVLVGRNGTLKITDFGISNTQARQALDEARIATVTGMTCSTPAGIAWANTPMYASD